jgi:glycosyltransferase involved in cell wall biosynthesis
MATYHGCFIFFGDVRYDSRLQNLVRTLSAAGRPLLVLQASDRDEEFEMHGARVRALGLDQRLRGFLRYLRFYALMLPAVRAVRAAFYCAEDLYSLPVAASSWRRHGGRMFYDSREIYSALGTLTRKPFKQKIWKLLEGRFIRKASVFTSGIIDSRHLAALYRIPQPEVVYNYPWLRQVPRNDSLRNRLKLEPGDLILLYQGMLAPGRGIGPMLEALLLLDSKFKLALIGDGPWSGELKDKSEQGRYQGRLFVLDRVPHDKLLEYTASADIGLTLIEGISASYRAALPNKLFEYIMCGTPPLASDLPAMKEVIDQCGAGMAIEISGPARIAKVIGDMAGRLPEFRAACRRAREELNWQKQEEKILNIFTIEDRN